MLSETVILAINKKIHELVITLSENSCCEKYHNSSVFSDCVGGKTGICTPADGEASQVRNVAVQTRYLQVGSAIGGWGHSVSHTQRPPQSGGSASTTP